MTVFKATVGQDLTGIGLLQVGQHAELDGGLDVYGRTVFHGPVDGLPAATSAGETRLGYVTAFFANAGIDNVHNTNLTGPSSITVPDQHLLRVTGQFLVHSTVANVTLNVFIANGDPLNAPPNLIYASGGFFGPPVANFNIFVTLTALLIGMAAGLTNFQLWANAAANPGIVTGGASGGIPGATSFLLVEDLGLA